MFKNFKYLVIFLFTAALLNPQDRNFKYSKIFHLEPQEDSSLVYTGLDLLVQNKFKTIKTKKLAVVFGSASYTRDGKHIVEVLESEFPGELVVFIQVLDYNPGKMYSGFKYKKVDPESKTNFICLTPDELKIGYADIKGCNLILYDLQDIGIRESAAIALLIELLKLSAESRIPLLVLDRPNPLTAKMVGGSLSANSPLAKNCPLPLRYGLTTAELAIMINDEDWLKLRKPARLYVVPIANYTQSMWYDNTGLFHINVYPDKLNAEVALLYNSLFFVDHTNLSNGLGTGSPYEIVGAPWISGDFVLSKLVDQSFSGVTFINRSFTPKVARGVHPKPNYDGEECSGIQIIVTNRDVYEPAVVGSYLIGLIAQLYPHHFEWIDTDYIDAIFGGYEYRRSIELGRDLNKFGAIWRAGLTNYQILHEKYRLYPPE